MTMCPRLFNTTLLEDEIISKKVKVNNMTKRELIEMIENDYCNGDIQETIESVNELINDIHINPIKFVNDLTEELEKYARDENNRCEICGWPLQEEADGEEHEYMGSPCSETPEWHCINPDCNNY